MADSCQVCAHPEVKFIDQMIGQGTTLAVLARRFELGEDAIGRHRTEHIDKIKFTSQVDPQALLRDLQVAKAEAELAMHSASDDDSKLRAIKEVRMTTESIAKLTGAFRAMDKRLMLPLWNRIKGTILAALKDHPAAREAVLSALEKAQAEMDNNG